MAPAFYDAEFVADNGLFLDTSVGILNHANFITGDVVTPRIGTAAFLNFKDGALYSGENKVSHIDGYAAMANKETFTFPVGNGERMRPLSVSSPGVSATAKCAYFYENPNVPSSFDENFPTSSKASDFLSVSELEFWHLESDVPTTVTLTWDEWSNIGRLSAYLTDLKVVGWHKERQVWENLGNTEVNGAMSYGSVTSEPFVPNDYAVITLGGNDDALEDYTTMYLANYFMSPNGDGVNDVLVLEGVERSPNNSIQIFNRYGVMVYSKSSYQNDFNGISNRKSAINRSATLESGVYYYIAILNDLRQKHQGYLYLTNNGKN